MVNIVKTANGQYSMLNNGKLLYGTFYKIERVAESSNFYCLWPNDSLFFLYNVNLCRYALKSETTSNAQTFLRIEHYSIESKSFIAYRSDNEYAHIIFEDGAFEEKTFQYVGIEAQIFLCKAKVKGKEWLFELKYTIRTHNWCIHRRVY